jgi:hypothetical protein
MHELDAALGSFEEGAPLPVRARETLIGSIMRFAAAAQSSSAFLPLGTSEPLKLSTGR